MPPIVVKLGSSVVADSDGRLREEVLAGVADQVAALSRAGAEPVIVTSGAIARGLEAIGIAPAQRTRRIGELQAASAVGQGKLYHVYDQLLAARDVASAQVLLTFFDISARSHYLNARQTLRQLLDWGVVPVINENDTTTTDEISFGDNDFLAAQVAILLGAELLVLLTVAGGVYTADPLEDPHAALVSEVRDIDELASLAIGHQTSSLGSGGMRSKVVAAEMATAAGIPTVIAGGLEPGVIEAAVSGASVGTRFLAGEPGRYSSFKLWLRYAKPTRGEVIVDAGAARALRDGGTSLLPVGISRVLGSFDAGDAVEVRHDGELIGKGIASYSASEMGRAQGLKSARIRELLPDAPAEAIHRDYFALA
ncbi:MAG: glutamate 5-kinase [Solirubrobacterales bacterium]|nr:glutamate 5-kinase [Solirubrobacterales bacterium]